MARGKPSPLPTEEDPWDKSAVQRFPPSERERRERAMLLLWFGIVMAVLVIGIVLRYTVFAAQFAPKTMPPPVISSTPQPSATPSPAE